MIVKRSLHNGGRPGPLHYRYITVVDLDRVRGGERGGALQTLEGEDADGPPVNGKRVATVLQHLGREVLGRAAEGPRLALHHLGEAQVGELHVAVGVEKQILRLPTVE